MKNRQTLFVASATAASCLLLGACAVGPNYVKPQFDVPAAYKENADWHAAGWTPAQPADAVKRGAWWEVFGDPVLNQYEEQIEGSNPTLAQSEAQYRQARALVSGARAAYFPIVSGTASASRSGKYGTTTTGLPLAPGAPDSSHPTDDYSLGLTASWEPDLWGKVRRTVEENVANAQASAATLASTRLSLQAELAQDYLQLRVTDEQRRFLDDTVIAFQKTMKLTQNQYNVGVAARADVVEADSQLKQAQAQAIDLGVQRAQLEHAIAILVGKAPADFSIAVVKLTLLPPSIPVGLPSELLQRRPDVAIAERQVAAANAQIGVAISAYFPTLTLGATGGFENSVLSKLLTLPSASWSLGPQLAATLFDGGARRAQTAQARAGWDAAVDNYRAVALAALQNVEDNLAALRILEQEAAVQADAVKSSDQFLQITLNQYKAGTVSYINVVTAQTAAYSNERSAITLLGTRLNDSLLLIKALGGGWQASDLPAAGDISLRDPKKATE